MTGARAAAAVVVAVHGVAHLAVYPVSNVDNSDVDASRFWVPLSLARDPAGLAARVLLVLATVSFVATALVLMRPASARWRIPAVIGGVASIAAVGLLWNRLQPRPGSLWVGAALSAFVVVSVLRTLPGGHHSVTQRGEPAV